ncbi:MULTISPECIES: YitT family protein [Paenibacillus]|uniref:UPF0750 membrane protein YitE n=1 Tax=Paenibacillus azoreducens TaxID=116718 RepID=A0A919Y9R3_9BACL|nr:MULTISPECIES: YitT family protein [Paenibacillus]GIO46756.1 UPF0750 membrane protein YitE [Paenibacillus azoreducens]
MKILMVPGRNKFYFYRRLYRKISLITAGAVIQGLAMAVFLFPHDIPSGGGSGIAVLLHHFFGLPMSLGFWFANFVFLIFTAPYLGNASTIGTIYVITVTSVSVNFFEVYIKHPFPNVWIDLLIGSVFLGTGVAMLMRQRVSNGGIGFAALALYKYKKIKPGTSLFWMNGFIFSLTAIVIDWKIIILAIGCQLISTRIINWLLRSTRPKARPGFGFAWRSGKK